MQYYTIQCNSIPYYPYYMGPALPKASKLRPDKPVGILLDTKANVTLVLYTGVVLTAAWNGHVWESGSVTCQGPEIRTGFFKD